RSTDDELRTARVAVDLSQMHLDPLLRAVAFCRSLLAGWHHGLGLAELDDHRAAVRTLHDTVEDLALLVLILAVDVLALEVADSRMYDLLDGLGGDSTEVLRCALDLDHIPGSSTGHVLLSLLDSHLGVRILNMLHDILHNDDLHLAGRGVQLDAYIFFAIRILFVDRCQCILD